MSDNFTRHTTIKDIVIAADAGIGLTYEEEEILHKRLKDLVKELESSGTIVTPQWFGIVYLLAEDLRGERRPDDDGNITEFIGKIAFWVRDNYLRDDGSFISNRNMNYLSYTYENVLSDAKGGGFDGIPLEGDSYW